MSASPRPAPTPEPGIRLSPGDRLPRLAVPRADGPGHVDLRGSPRDATLLLVLPREATAAGAYWKDFADAVPRFRDWGARVLVVLPPDADPDAGFGDRPEFRRAVAFVEHDVELRRRLGLAIRDGAAVVADRWGIVYLARAADRLDDLPSPAVLEEQLKFIATQCPECGVLDMPQEIERWSPP